MNKPIGWSESRDQGEWDEFVTDNGGSAFHLWSWRRVLEGDGFRPIYMAYRGADGRITAVCPFFSRAGKHLQYLESLPDTSTAGPVIGDRCDDPSGAITALPKSVKFSLSSPIVAMRIRTHQERLIELMRRLKFEEKATGELFVLDLGATTPERIWKDSFNKHDRQAVKFYEERAEFRFVDDERELLSLARPDWRYYSGRLFQEGFITRMKAKVGERLRVALAIDSGGVPLAGFLMLLDPQDGPNSGVHLLAVRYSVPNNIHSAVTYLNWKAVNWATEKGIRYIDFGSYSRTRSANPTDVFHKLKARFGITSMPRYEYTLPVSTVTFSIARKLRRVL